MQKSWMQRPAAEQFMWIVMQEQPCSPWGKKGDGLNLSITNSMNKLGRWGGPGVNKWRVGCCLALLFLLDELSWALRVGLDFQQRVQVGPWDEMAEEREMPLRRDRKCSYSDNWAVSLALGIYKPVWRGWMSRRDCSIWTFMFNRLSAWR